MKSFVLSLAALAAIGLSGAAYAGDATAPKAMSDSEMDNVTAAGGPPPADARGLGIGTAGIVAGGTEAKPPSIAGQSGVSPGGGKNTAPSQQ